MDLTHGPIWGLWHGGNSYSRPDRDDLEVFGSIEDALIECENRFKSSHFPHEFVYVRKAPASTHTPGVDESSTMEIYLANPGDDGDLIPDLVLRYDEEADRFQVAPDYEYVLAYRTITHDVVNGLADLD